MKPRLNFRICRLYFRHRVIPSVSELWLWMDPQILTISYGHISWWRMALNLTGTPIFKRCKKSISTHLVGLKPERLNWPPFTHFFFCVCVCRKKYRRCGSVMQTGRTGLRPWLISDGASLAETYLYTLGTKLEVICEHQGARGCHLGMSPKTSSEWQPKKSDEHSVLQ